MGVSGALNDRYTITGPVNAFLPNDFGLYNMAGNVNEWVMDVYRETSNFDLTEYNSYRGNIYGTPRVENGSYVYNELGQIAIDWNAREDSKKRAAVDWNRDDDKRNYKDGDSISVIDTDYPLEMPEKRFRLEQATDDDGNEIVGRMDTVWEESDFLIDPTDVLCPRITNKTRVYKGGSWADRIYWLNPSARRYLDEDQCTSTIGFRCAMSTLGDQIPSTPIK